MTRGLNKDSIRRDAMFFETLENARLAFCITDPREGDNPIRYANRAFFELTGYGEAEIVGRNCRFLQGPETTPESIQAVRAALQSRSVQTVDLINYRKSGEKFLNALQLGPIFDENGTLTGFFGSQLDVTAQREVEGRARQEAQDELTHRLLNILNVMTSLVRLTRNETTDPKTFVDLVESRIRAIGKAHFLTLKPGQALEVSFRELATVVVGAYAPGGTQRFRANGPDIALPNSMIPAVSMILHELATNAVKHGALSQLAGAVDLSWSELRDEGNNMLRLSWREEGGPLILGIPTERGSALSLSLLEAAGGKITRKWRREGLIATVSFPIGN